MCKVVNSSLRYIFLIFDNNPKIISFHPHKTFYEFMKFSFLFSSSINIEVLIIYHIL